MPAYLAADAHGVRGNGHATDSPNRIADAPYPLSLMVSIVEIAYSCNLLRLLCTP
jgi:hypothetical protein